MPAFFCPPHTRKRLLPQARGHRPKHAGWLLLLVLACGLATPAQADTQTPFYGARSLAMGGAHRGITSSNDAVFVNQAAMAMERRYSAELQYLYDSDHISRLMASTVDSKTAAVAAGVAYGRVWGNPSGEHAGLNQINMALGWAPLSAFSVGLGAINLNGSFRDNGQHVHLNHFNATLSTMVSLAQILNVGLSWENFIPTGKAPQLTPRGLGMGVGIQTSLFRLAADLRFSLAKGQRTPRTLDVGGEAMVARFLTLRGGWRLIPAKHDPRAKKENVVAFGAAGHFGGGGLEFGMEKALTSRAWRLAVGLQFSM